MRAAVLGEMSPEGGAGRGEGGNDMGSTEYHPRR